MDRSVLRKFNGVAKTSSLLNSDVISTAGRNLRFLAFARNDSRMCATPIQHSLNSSEGAKILLLAFLLLSPNRLLAQQPLRAELFSARLRRRSGLQRKGITSRSMESK